MGGIFGANGGKIPHEGWIVLQEGRSSFLRNNQDTGQERFPDCPEELLRGRKDGDFLEWHETGSLKSKSQYQFGMRHGYFYVWTKDGKIYSRRYFQEDLEDFGRFEDQEPPSRAGA